MVANIKELAANDAPALKNKTVPCVALDDDIVVRELPRSLLSEILDMEPGVDRDVLLLHHGWTDDTDEVIPIEVVRVFYDKYPLTATSEIGQHILDYNGVGGKKN